MCYTNAKRDSNAPSIPTVATGMDVSGIVRMLMGDLQEKLAANIPFEKAVMHHDVDALNKKLSKLPDKPDEELR